MGRNSGEAALITCGVTLVLVAVRSFTNEAALAIATGRVTIVLEVVGKLMSDVSAILGAAYGLTVALEVMIRNTNEATFVTGVIAVVGVYVRSLSALLADITIDIALIGVAVSVASYISATVTAAIAGIVVLMTLGHSCASAVVTNAVAIIVVLVTFDHSYVSAVYNVTGRIAIIIVLVALGHSDSATAVTNPITSVIEYVGNKSYVSADVTALIAVARVLMLDRVNEVALVTVNVAGIIECMGRNSRLIASHGITGRIALVDVIVRSLTNESAKGTNRVAIALVEVRYLSDEVTALGIADCIAVIVGVDVLDLTGEGANGIITVGVTVVIKGVGNRSLLAAIIAGNVAFVGILVTGCFSIVCARRVVTDAVADAVEDMLYVALLVARVTVDIANVRVNVIVNLAYISALTDVTGRIAIIVIYVINDTNIATSKVAVCITMVIE